MSNKYKRWSIAMALTLTGCVTAAWAANNFGNTTITGTLTVVGNIVASGLSGLETLTLTDTAGVPQITMDGTSAGGTGVAYNNINIKAKKTGGAAVASDEVALSLTSQVWNGSAYVAGPYIKTYPNAVSLQTPSGGGFLVSGTDTDVTGPISAESITTTDGGITLSDTGLVRIETDGYVGTTVPSLTEVLQIAPSVDGVSSFPLSYSSNADASEWKWDLGGGNAYTDETGFHAGVSEFQGDATFLAAIFASAALFQDGTDFVAIAPTQIQTNGLIETASLILTSGPTLDSTNFASGAYTPTVSAGVNVGSTANVGGYYTRAGSDIIAGSVRLTITPTLGIATSFELSLPVASAFSTARQAIGSGTFQGTVNQPVFVSSSSTNDTLVVSFLSDVTAVAKELTINFQYEKI